MDIRLAEIADLPEIERIYVRARAYMANEGNPHQWGNVQPPLSKINNDIKNRCLYLLYEGKEVYGVFALTSYDPCYLDKETAWKDDSPYLVIHSLSSDGRKKGIFARVLAFSSARCAHLRIDTHKDNKTMRHLIEKAGFYPCGYCHQPDGSLRLCYERN